MNSTVSPNEILAAGAFNKQSVLFDEIYSADTIIQYKRETVREHINRFIKPRSRILELNAGTGEDAVYFAQQGHTVHATDISPGMLDQLAGKVHKNNLTDKITFEQCSYTSLAQLGKKEPYDHIFSNFAGLNCTDQLDKVLLSLSPLVKPGGVVTLVILPRFCLWEFLLILKGKFGTAFRRFSGRKGARSHIEGVYFTCWYYNPSFVKKCMQKDFTHLRTEGLCTFVPPSYFAGFAKKHPRVFTFLCRMENKYRNRWPWRSTGDYYMISLRRE